LVVEFDLPGAWINFLEIKIRATLLLAKLRTAAAGVRSNN
jgi:hypothetical protein